MVTHTKTKRGPKPDKLLGNRLRIPAMVSSKTHRRLTAIKESRLIPPGRAIDTAMDLLWDDPEYRVPGIN